MLEFSDMSYLNNFLIKTPASIGAEPMEIIPCKIPDFDEAIITLTLSSESGDIFEIVEAVYLDDVTESGGGPSGFVLATRGNQGTMARAWPAASRVYCSLTAGFANEAVARLKALDDKVIALENSATSGEYTGRLQVGFLFDTPRDGTLDRITEIRKENFIGNNSWRPEAMGLVTMPLGAFELEGYEAFVLTGSRVRRARLVLSEGYGDQVIKGRSQFLKISVTGADSDYSGACEVGLPATIQIIQDGMVLGEERVQWPAKESTDVYHIEYQFY